jgi:hypothetical protein
LREQFRNRGRADRPPGAAAQPPGGPDGRRPPGPRGGIVPPPGVLEQPAPPAR